MKIAVIIFCYNRSFHVGKVIDALSKNTVKPEKLYIFQDGMKKTTSKNDWIKVSEVINKIDWCEKEIVISEYNKGLADSVVNGVNKVLEKNDAVIVLEDDCVPHQEYMHFMIKSLEKYKNRKEVFCISGCAEEVEILKDDYDAYFMRRGSSLGWGTWKDRWCVYKRDYNILKAIKRDSEKNLLLENWGPDLKNILISNIEGETDSWAVFWDLTIMNNKGYTLCPFESLIENIGFDGSGIHSNKRTFNIKLREENYIEDFKLPDIIEEKQEYMKEFKFHYTRLSNREKLQFNNKCLMQWINNKIQGYSILNAISGYNNVGIWGIGDLTKLLINELGKENIRCIILSDAERTEYEGIKVYRPEEIDIEIDVIIIIPAFAINKIRRVCNKNNITAELIGIDELLKCE